MGLAYIRNYYGVPAKRGQRVKYSGMGLGVPLFGRITSARGSHINVLLDGHPFPMNFHPTWKMEYLTE